MEHPTTSFREALRELIAAADADGLPPLAQTVVLAATLGGLVAHADTDDATFERELANLLLALEISARRGRSERIAQPNTRTQPRQNLH